MAIEKTVELKIDAKEALKRLDAVEKELSDINKTAKQTEKGTAALATGFRGIGLAWKAIGIGAVISALQFLADKFSANQQILDKVNIASAVFGDILTQIGTVVISVVKGLGLLGKAVGKVLKGEFKEAGEIAKESFNGVKEAVVGNNESFSDFIKNAKGAAKESVQFGKDLINLRNEVKLAEAQQRQLQLTFQKEAEIQRQIRDDISLTFEERIAANTKLGEILDAQFEEEEALAQKKVELAELELSRNKDNIDLQVALIDAKTETADLDERITGQRSEQLTNLKALEKEYNDSLIKETKKTSKEVLKVDTKTGKDRLKIQQATDAAKKAATISAGKSILAGIGQLAGEGTKVGKAAAVAQILIDTASGISSAIAGASAAGASSGPLAPVTTPLLIAQLVGTVLAGIGQAKAILGKVKDGGGAGELSGIDSVTPSAGGAVSVPDVEPEEDSPTGLGPLIPNIEAITTATQPIQAFVVENDISSSQALQEELEVQATL
tara:strand:- start:282 stop:1772 length:1491 start_codon:yes stop_codon:yes gene_type:complete